MSDIKQVIVMRHFPGIKTGKYIAQACHACMGIFFRKLQEINEENHLDNSSNIVGWKLDKLPYFEEFISGKFKKIVLKVETEEELFDIHHKALTAGIHCSLIKDAGLTEFNGVSTYTAVGIGPWDAKEIDKITKHLPLL